MMLVLHHVPEPAEALAEAARVLRPGGRLLIVDMLPHDRDEYRQQMGHVWLGFSRDQIERLLGDSRLRRRAGVAARRRRSKRKGRRCLPPSRAKAATVAADVEAAPGSGCSVSSEPGTDDLPTPVENQ